MKKLFFACLGLFIFNHLAAQVGVGTQSPSNASMLDVSSTSDGGLTYRGLMPPKVPSITERDMITATAVDAGLIVFVISTGCMQLWDGDSWEDIECFTITLPTSEPWINEIHYDNSGTDTDEGYEIAGPAGTDLSEFEVTIYNGIDGSVLTTNVLTGVIDDESNGVGAVWFGLPSNTMQNGGPSPDGLALHNTVTGIVQLLSYEGVFVATEGPANGMTSINIGVEELGSTPVGESLQLSGTGRQASDFTWNPPQTHTRDNLNTGQIIN